MSHYMIQIKYYSHLPYQLCLRFRVLRVAIMCQPTASVLELGPLFGINLAWHMGQGINVHFCLKVCAGADSDHPVGVRITTAGTTGASVEVFPALWLCSVCFE